jgi:sugar lactone lactonase YvrE
MEDFNELDNEILRLKMELNSPGFLRPPEPHGNEIDYWKSRLNEERLSLETKAKSQDAEKQLLENKIQQQQNNINRYEQALKDMEAKLQRETHQLEDRLRMRESELLIEQNRILSEEKVKITEIEKNQLRDKITDLAEKIVSLKEESSAVSATHIKERENARQEIESLLAMISSLKKDVSEEQMTIREKEMNIASLTENYARTTNELADKKEALETERSEHALELAAIKKKNDEALAQTSTMIYEMGRHFVKQFNQVFVQLVGMAAYAAKRPDAAPVEKVLTELIGKIEAEAHAYADSIDAPEKQDDPCMVAVLGTDEDHAVVKEALKKTAISMHVLSPKHFMREIAVHKPRLVIVSGANASKRGRLAKKWPFLPQVLLGPTVQRISNTTSVNTYPLVHSAAITEIADTILEAAGRSIARSEYWDRLSQTRPSAWRALAAAGVILAVGVVSGGWWGYQHFVAVPAMVQTPYSNPTNITFDGKSLWVCDWFGQSIYRQDTHGEIQKALCFPNKHFTALTWANGYLWSCDSWDKKIFKHKADDTLSIVASYPTPGLMPSGITWDGQNLWTCDTATGQIFKHVMDAKLSVVEAYDSPGGSPSGLYFDGKSLWSIDSRTSKLYRHLMTGRLPVAEVYTLPVAVTEKISGITGDGKNLWLCSEKSGHIFYRPIKQLKS